MELLSATVKFTSQTVARDKLTRYLTVYKFASLKLYYFYWSKMPPDDHMISQFVFLELLNMEANSFGIFVHNVELIQNLQQR